MMKISIIGTGYVGFVTGLCLAEKGHRVICVDVDQKKVDSINSGIASIYEKGLNGLLKNQESKRTFVPYDSSYYEWILRQIKI